MKFISRVLNYYMNLTRYITFYVHYFTKTCLLEDLYLTHQTLLQERYSFLFYKIKYAVYRPTGGIHGVYGVRDLESNF